jgi:hypothetical protein
MPPGTTPIGIADKPGRVFIYADITVERSVKFLKFGWEVTEF